MANVSMKDASKINWHSPAVNKDGYPGDTNIQLGCLMRIADATEKMASNYIALQNDLQWYKKRYAELEEENERLARSIRAYKGIFNKKKRK